MFNIKQILGIINYLTFDTISDLWEEQMLYSTHFNQQTKQNCFEVVFPY